MKVRIAISRSLVIGLVSYLLSVPLLLSAADTPAAVPQAQWRWEVPHQLSDANTEVTFEVDSTWHLVKGTTSGLDGRVWLANSADPLSIRATVKFPVKEFVTGGESRDERMREVMDSEQFPYVTLAVDSFEPHCTPENFTGAGMCPVTLGARLSIRGNERPIVLTATLAREAERVALSGTTRFLWADFGVEDPSIVIAKLDPEVVVSYSVRLPMMTHEEG